MSRHLHVRHAVLAFHVKIIHCPTAFSTFKLLSAHLLTELAHESLWPDRALILVPDTQVFLLLLLGAVTENFHSLQCVFPNCTDTLFSITIVSSVLCLSVLRGLLPSCAYAVISIQDDFIPGTGDCCQLLF